MKIKIVTFLLFLFFQKSFTQNKEWLTYDLDSIVFLDMPFDVYELDTIINLKKHYQISSNKNSSKFVAQKTYIGKSFINEDIIVLPKDYKSLKKYYLNIIWAFDEITEYKLKDYKPIQKNKLEGYEIIFINKNDIIVQQMALFLVNKNLYLFSYTDETGLDELNKKSFFSNINFDDREELKQYPKQSFFTIRNVFLILCVFLFISYILRFKSKKRKST